MFMQAILEHKLYSKQQHLWKINTAKNSGLKELHQHDYWTPAITSNYLAVIEMTANFGWKLN